MATFSLTNATYNFSLSIVPSFSLLNRNVPPNNPSALSIFHYRLCLSYLTDVTSGTRRYRVIGQRTPEVNKVVLTALKYCIALISATIISYLALVPFATLIKYLH